MVIDSSSIWSLVRHRFDLALVDLGIWLINLREREREREREMIGLGSTDDQRRGGGLGWGSQTTIVCRSEKKLCQPENVFELTTRLRRYKHLK